MRGPTFGPGPSVARMPTGRRRAKKRFMAVYRGLDATNTLSVHSAGSPFRYNRRTEGFFSRIHTGLPFSGVFGHLWRPRVSFLHDSKETERPARRFSDESLRRGDDPPVRQGVS